MNKNPTINNNKYSNLPPEIKERFRKELEAFALRSKEIDLLENALAEQFNKVSSESDSPLFAELLEKKRKYNEALENTDSYQEILPWVMNEVYTCYVYNYIKREKGTSPIIKDDEERNKIIKALALLMTNPGSAAEQLFQFGCCHELWQLQRDVLKELFDINWYSPAQLNPHIIYD